MISLNYSLQLKSSPKLHILGNPLDGIKKFVEHNYTIVKAQRRHLHPEHSPIEAFMPRIPIFRVVAFFFQFTDVRAADKEFPEICPAALAEAVGILGWRCVRHTKGCADVRVADFEGLRDELAV